MTWCHLSTAARELGARNATFSKAVANNVNDLRARIGLARPCDRENDQFGIDEGDHSLSKFSRVLCPARQAPMVREHQDLRLELVMIFFEVRQPRLIDVTSEEHCGLARLKNAHDGRQRIAGQRARLEISLIG